MKNTIKTFEANTKGRDFVIGDLHGSFSVLVNLLDNLKFDGDVDRLFSVGDLVDRGPMSLECLKLMENDWFHCVLANHEQMMLEAFRGGPMGEYWLMNGGMWGYQSLADLKVLHADPDSELEDLLDIIAELPYLITVDLVDGSKAHIIHAEFPPNVDLNDEILADPEKVREIATVQTRDGDFCVWGRFRFYQFFNKSLDDYEKIVRTAKYHVKDLHEGLSPIYSGHTIMQRPISVFGQMNIDTGAYQSYKPVNGSPPAWAALTAVELNTGKIFQATETSFKEVQAVVVNTLEPI